MAKAVIQANIQTSSGTITVAPNASVAIRNSDSGALVSLWTDRAGTIAASNPVTADSNGFFRVYATAQRVNITATYGGSSQTWNDVLITNNLPIRQELTTISAVTTLDSTYIGKLITLSGTTYTATLPAANTVQSGDTLELKCTASGDITITRASTDTIGMSSATVTSMIMKNGDTLTLVSNGSNQWIAMNAFIQSGTGAVGRGQNAKNREWKTPYDFGAAGDGTTDDLAELNAALTAIGSGTLYFPSGCVCGISAVLTISNSNVTLLFEDWSAGIKPLAAMTNLISITGDGVKITGGAIYNQSSYATNGISRSGTSNFGCSVEGCYIASFTNGIVYSGSGNAGLYLSHNYFNANTDKNISFTEDGRSCSIVNNFIQGGKYGLHATHTTQQMEGLYFAGNNVFPTVTGGGPIYINGALACNIVDNVLDTYGTGTCIILNAGTVDHQITYLNIERNHLGIVSGSTGISTVQNCSYIKIKDNTFDGTTSSVGLNASALTFSRIESNEFVGLTGTQIALTNACTYNNFINNQMRGSGTIATEDSNSQNIWFGNYGTVATKSPKSFFLYNWTDDVLAAESDWTAYTPVVTPSGGSITYTAVGAYRRLGKTIEFTVTITMTANTGTGSLLVTLPATAAATYPQVVSGQQYVPAVYSVAGLTNTSAASMFVYKYDGTYPASAANSVIAISGVYKAA